MITATAWWRCSRWWAGSTSVLAQYTYDALNRRIGVSEGGATTWTVYDGTSTDPLIDFDGSGDVTARYLNGPSPAGVDAVLARDTPSGGVAWYLADRLGSVGDIVNNSGTVIDHIDYTAFGTPTQTNPSEGDRFEFAGMQYDAVIGQYYDEARWYDPARGSSSARIKRDSLGATRTFTATSETIPWTGSIPPDTTMNTSCNQPGRPDPVRLHLLELTLTLTNTTELISRLRYLGQILGLERALIN